MCSENTRVWPEYEPMYLYVILCTSIYPHPICMYNKCSLYLQRNSTSYSVNQDLDIAEMDSKLIDSLTD